MDGSKLCWYFSKMARASSSAEGSLEVPELVEFHRTKYGRELLVDAGRVADYRGFDRGGRAHRLDFHDILLVTRGRGTLWIDVETHRVEPGVVFFTRPHETRRWALEEAVDGACVFFREDFVSATFADPRFLEQFAFFRAGRGSSQLQLTRVEHERYLERFAIMEAEIAALHPDSPQALRAVLYGFLVQLNRWYSERHPLPGSTTPNRLVERFLARVEERFAERMSVADYAADLGVSPGHLSALCRGSVQKSAGAVVRGRTVLEAQRLLLYSSLTAAQIATRLGFDDPAYFSRFFRRETRHTPTGFRRASQTGWQERSRTDSRPCLESSPRTAAVRSATATEEEDS